MPQTCYSGNEAVCGAVHECEANQDCEVAKLSACAQSTCEFGICFEDSGQAASCQAGRVCSLEDGCVPEGEPCQENTDCSEATECRTAECILSRCIYSNVDELASCTSHDGGACFSGICVAPTCDDGIKNTDETDIDCGGSCQQNCVLGQMCAADFDCQTGVCDALEGNRCENVDVCGNGRVETAEFCDDGNQSPGDGCGTTCRYEIGAACALSQQCESGVCDTLESNTCEPANTCGNGVVEGSESCDDGSVVNLDGCNEQCLLELGETCTVHSDCASAQCGPHNRCEPTTCGDGIINNDESDVDCGGSCGARCAVGKLCNFYTDCSEFSCAGGLCVVPGCDDGVKNGDELGADCGEVARRNASRITVRLKRKFR